MIAEEKKIFLERVLELYKNSGKDVRLKRINECKSFGFLKDRLDGRVVSFENFSYPKKGVSDEEMILYFLLINSINHKFWEIKNGKIIRYENNGNVGAIAMGKGISQWILSEGSIEAFFKNKKRKSDLDNYLGEIPGAQMRLEIINEVILKGKEIQKIIIKKMKNGFGIKLAQDISEHLSLGYKDVFLKKAQLALFMMATHFKNEKSMHISECLTSFPDYQIPKVLEGLGFIEYSESLKKHINDGVLIEKNSKEEIGLRAASVLAIEEISKMTKVSSVEIDLVLWSMRTEIKANFHLSDTTCY